MLLEVLELSEEVCMQIVKLLKSVFLDLDDQVFLWYRITEPMSYCYSLKTATLFERLFVEILLLDHRE